VSDLEYIPRFSWAMPRAFSRPVSECRFERGDILYNTSRAYEGRWDEAVDHVDFGLQVRFPDRGISGGVVEGAELFSSNWGRPVAFDLTNYRTKEIRHITTAQGGLYGFLWKGKVEHVQSLTPLIDVPLAAMGLLPSASLEEKDVLDWSELFNKLKSPSATCRVGTYLRTRLSVATKDALVAGDGELSAPIRTRILEDLNMIIGGPSIFDLERFREVNLRDATRLMNSNTSGRRPTSRLNRALLEDAFPGFFWQLREYLAEAAEFLRDDVKGRGTLLVMPHDSCLDTLRTKCAQVQRELESAFDAVVQVHDPIDLGLVAKNGFAPTVEVATFWVPGKQPADLEQHLKKALYTPTRGRLTSEDRFLVSKHGHLLEKS
jgi:hypothetical protein